MRVVFIYVDVQVMIRVMSWSELWIWDRLRDIIGRDGLNRSVEGLSNRLDRLL